MSKRYVRLLVLLLSYLSLVQAAAYEREGIAGRRLARTGDRQHGKHRGQKGQAEGSPQGSVLIVTETVKETVTAAAGSCTAANGTITADTVTETATVTVTQKENAGALPGTGNLQLSFVTTTVFGTGSPSTVTITALPETITQTIAATITETAAPSTLTETIAQTITSLQVVASTETVTQIQSVPGTCSSQVPGVVAGAPAGTAVPANNDGLPRASGGVGLTVVSIPAALRTSTLEIPPPAATDVPAISTSVSLAETTATSTTLSEVETSATSSVAELPTTSTTAEETVTTSTNELTTSSTEVAIVPSSTTELATFTTEIATTSSTTAPAVAITSVVSVEPPSPTSTSSSSTTTVAGIEPTSVLVLPAVSAANPTTTAVAPDVANGGIQFTLDVSGLTLTNVLNLGNLVPPTAAARP